MSVKRYSVWEDEMFEEKHAINSTNGMVHLMVKHEDYAALEHKLAESQREFRAADATIENLQMQVEKLAAENAGLKEYLAPAGLAVEGTPATDAFLAEVRAQGAEECVRQLVTSDDDDFSDAPNVCAEVARQFRKGVQS
ncbi:hypothetical protein ACQFCN_001236 [Enterobacter cloacae]